MNHHDEEIPSPIFKCQTRQKPSQGAIGSSLNQSEEPSVSQTSATQVAPASLTQILPKLNLLASFARVLIRRADNRITGIVTSSDLSLQFRQLTEPFLLLGEIENHIRQILGVHFCVEELRRVADPSDSERQINRVADLNFGEYIRLLENPDCWSKLQIEVDRKTFVGLLDRLRLIRNDVMHFDPDGIPGEDLEFLRNCVRFVQRLHSLGVT